MSKICSCLRKTTTLFSLLHLWHNAYSCILFPKTSQRRSSSFEANIIIGDSLCFLTQPHSVRRISRTSMCSAVKHTSLKIVAAPRSSWFQKGVREERIKTHMGGLPGLDLKYVTMEKNTVICWGRERQKVKGPEIPCQSMTLTWTTHRRKHNLICSLLTSPVFKAHVLYSYKWELKTFSV